MVRLALRRDNEPSSDEQEASDFALIEWEAKRIPPPSGGFTPFAYEHMLQDSGHPADTRQRPYILGGNVTGRVRVQTRATLSLVFNFYVGRSDLTHLWVQWTDGRRHLIHRKGC
jgi:hypothetical protein